MNKDKIVIEVQEDSIGALQSLQGFCRERKIGEPKIFVEATAEALSAEISGYKTLLQEIAADKKLSKSEKDNLTTFLAALSHKMKHMLASPVVQAAADSTESRDLSAQRSGVLDNLQGIRVG
jgi:hypothetical protein